MTRASASDATNPALEDRKKRLRECFLVFDADGNGKIDAEELKAILTRSTEAGTELTVADCQDIINDFDDDKDGMLDFEEFVRAWHFDVKEQVTLEEVEAEASVVMERRTMAS
jgi:calcium-binding protein CML